MRLIGDDNLAPVAFSGAVVDDRGQVIVGEPAGDRGQPGRLIHLAGTDDGGQLGRCGPC